MATHKNSCLGNIDSLSMSNDESIEKTATQVSLGQAIRERIGAQSINNGLDWHERVSKKLAPLRFKASTLFCAQDWEEFRRLPVWVCTICYHLHSKL
jgi:hypothetical protein